MDSNRLSTLGYTKEWIDGGFLDEDLLTRQLAEYVSESGGTEHFRYRAFLDWINARSDYTDSEVAGLITLVALDEDRFMASDAGIRLSQPMTRR